MSEEKKHMKWGILGAGNISGTFAAAVNGYEYEALAAMDAVREGGLECPEHTQEDVLKILGQMDDLRNMWDIYYPCE